MTGCWWWMGAYNRAGYGRTHVIPEPNVVQHLLAHRVAWQLANGPIPRGLLVRHRCDHPECVNPDHLLLGTDADNIRDRETRGRTARGERSGSRVHPDRLARGDRNGARLHPERWRRGEGVNTCKLTAAKVTEIRRLAARGVATGKLVRRFGVNQQSVWNIVHRHTWKHVA